MNRQHKYKLFTIKKVAAMLGGGTVLSIASCDPEVTSALLTGFQTALVGVFTSVTDAFFMAITNNATSQTAAAASVLTNWLA